MGFTFDFGGEAARVCEETPSATGRQGHEAKQLEPQSEQMLVSFEKLDICPDTVLYRRCLFDVNYDLAMDDRGLDQSDLIPGVYEGGYKTWEASLDLAAYLDALPRDSFHAQQVLEIGCGSGLPGLVCLRRGSTVVFQDYNEDVLRRVTVPNVCLNLKQEATSAASEDTTVDTLEAFQQCSFWSGDWTSFQEQLTSRGTTFDWILTSETLYEQSSHKHLYDLIKSSLRPSGTALLATKVNYFGCSGSLELFLDLVESDGAMKATEVACIKDTVHRKIIQLRFIENP